MSEFLDALSHKASREQDNPALFSERSMLEGFSPEMLIDFKQECLIKISMLENYVHMTNDILDGYGVNDKLVGDE